MSFNLKNCRSFIKYLLSILIILLPVQTPIGQFLVYNLKLSGILLLWKEVIVLLIFIIFLVYFYKLLISRKDLDGEKTIWKTFIKSDIAALIWPLLVFIGLFLWGLFTSIFINKLPFSIFLLGGRFELWWLGLLAVLCSLNNLMKRYDKDNLKIIQLKLLSSFYIGFGILSIFTVFTLIFNQSSVLKFLGYSTLSNSEVSPQLCHSIDAGINVCRLSGGFSSPNHFAGYLLIFLPFVIFQLIDKLSILFSKRKDILKEITTGAKIKEKLAVKWVNRLIYFTIILNFILFFLIKSNSRYSWFGIVAFLSFGILVIIYKRLFWTRNFKFKKIIINSLATLFIFLAVAPAFFIFFLTANSKESASSLNLPTFISKPSSSDFHTRRTQATLKILQSNGPQFFLGYGIGASGPVGKLSYYNIKDYPLFKNNEYIAYQNGLVGEDLLIPENWYLQLILNGGIFYAIIYIILIGFIPAKNMTALLGDIFRKNDLKNNQIYNGCLSIAIFSIMIGNLFLHIWESQSVSILFAILFFMYKETGNQKDDLLKTEN